MTHDTGLKPIAVRALAAMMLALAAVAGMPWHGTIPIGSVLVILVAIPALEGMLSKRNEGRLNV
jgi:hypothetical protein